MGCFPSRLVERTESMDAQSSQTEFRYINGRRFHNVENVKYHLPNDENESDRLHSQHFILRYLWQSNFSSPVDHILSKPGAKVRDIIGLDISPHQPTTIKPKNFDFVKSNVEEGLPFDDNNFDFVFQRLLVIGITKEKWPYVVNELVRVLKPGGFLELYPFTYIKFHSIYHEEYEILEQQGSDFDSYQKLEEYCRNQGTESKTAKS
ncbi:3755_t:CDS:2 [Racocetra fulgida]|uniref:3755_t:CDS:1 n=1 Tax=Racocetra fulgida TaxID=60492 RepID=A0A9N9DUV7_9GLOM|nr:3755_t:CDS:2 [Racocetra fulgida]